MGESRGNVGIYRSRLRRWDCGDLKTKIALE